VVKAFGSFIKDNPMAKLYMIYHTKELEPEILNYQESLAGLRQSLVLPGQVNHAEMQYWYNSADFLISGSHYEGSGVAVCEAMSCGCIPILTDIISFRKMTGPRKCGLLYQAGNPAALLVALNEAVNMDIAVESARAIKQFKEELSFEAIAKKIDQVITSL
jgi:glycosyltransferase involved in cell wall biosynthesis